MTGGAPASSNRRTASVKTPVASVDGEFLARLGVADARAADAVRLLQQRNDAHVVRHARAKRRGGLRQRDSEAGVIELAVLIADAAAQAAGFHVRKSFHRALTRKPPRRRKSEFTREPVVEFQPDAVIGRFPPMIARHDEVQRLHEMRRVAQEQPPLAQRLAHERDVSLPQVSEAAVNQFGAAAGSPLREITLLHQRRLQPARRRVHRHAETRRPAADDEHVPKRGLLQQGGDCMGAVHAGEASKSADEGDSSAAGARASRPQHAREASGL
jgi:hypothetical protein